MTEQVTTEQVSDKVLNVADQALDGVSGLMVAAGEMSSKFAELAVTHGQSVVDLGLNVVRIGALGSVFSTIALAIVIALTVNFSMNQWKRANELWAINHSDRKTGEDPDSNSMFALISGVIAICLVMAISVQASLWSFIGVIWPELYIAHQIMDKAL